MPRRIGSPAKSSALAVGADDDLSSRTLGGKLFTEGPTFSRDRLMSEELAYGLADICGREPDSGNRAHCGIQAISGDFIRNFLLANVSLNEEGLAQVLG